jgi:hypothetical protein
LADGCWVDFVSGTVLNWNYFCGKPGYNFLLAVRYFMRQLKWDMKIECVRFLFSGWRDV